MTLALTELTTGGVEVKASTGWRIREAVRDRVQTLELPGMPKSSDRIVHRTIPSVQGLSYPCTVISKTRGRFGGVPSPTGRVDNAYAVGILLVRASSRGLDASTPESRQLDAWFEEVADSFNETRPDFFVPGVCIINCRVVDNDPRVLALWVQQMDAVLVTVHVTARKELVRG